MTDLIALAEKVESLTGPCALTWAEVQIALHGFPRRAYEQRNGMRPRGEPPLNEMEWAASHFGAGGTGYLDDAVQLVSKGYQWGVGSRDATGAAWAWAGLSHDASATSNAATPALALTAAALRSHAAQKEG